MHILLHRDENYKGILVINHGEQEKIKKYLPKLSKRYHIIVHLQWSMRPIQDKHVSLYMVPSNYCKTKKDIPFTVVHLVDKVFDYTTDIEMANTKVLDIMQKYNIKHSLEMKNERMIDFIYIGRCSGIKKTLEVVKYFNYLSSKGFVTCMIILKQDSKDSYYQKFCKLEKEKIIIIDTHNLEIENDEFHGLKIEDVSLFYRTSKIYVHSCEDEGSSRAIHEAICSGCYLMCKENMIGGGLNELTKKNSTLYTQKNFYQKVEKAVQDSKKYQCCDQDIEKCSEKFTLNKFLEIIYNKLGYQKIEFQEFVQKCDVEKIQLKFPAHYFKVPWYIKGKLTASLDEKNIDIFLKHIDLK